MKLLHTSDWHIGRALHNRKRYDEFELFLNWLVEIIEQENIDVLLVAGDVFDNTTPSNRAQELYYRFLCRVASADNRHVIVVAGNHDSPSFLEAPKELLKFLNVHVVGSASENPSNEVVVISGQEGDARLIVCAIPYLRDRDIRTAEAGESVEDKERKIIEGIRNHYRLVCDAAERKRNELGKQVPIVAMGHLFAAGGRTTDDDGVRELYIGTLAQVKADVFPECIDYLALGHLHVPQTVGGSEFIRYCGSPLPMSFGENGQQKGVAIVEFIENDPAVRLIPVPCFQELQTIRGDWLQIAAGIAGLKGKGSKAWLEIIYEGEEIIANLQERLEEITAGSALEILRTKNNRLVERVLSGMEAAETLDDLNATEVFKRCLKADGVPEEQHEELLNAYREIIVSINEQDVREE